MTITQPETGRPDMSITPATEIGREQLAVTHSLRKGSIVYQKLYYVIIHELT
jgi:hypothetical protein